VGVLDAKISWSLWRDCFGLSNFSSHSVVLAYTKVEISLLKAQKKSQEEQWLLTAERICEPDRIYDQLATRIRHVVNETGIRWLRQAFGGSYFSFPPIAPATYLVSPTGSFPKPKNPAEPALLRRYAQQSLNGCSAAGRDANEVEDPLRGSESGK